MDIDIKILNDGVLLPVKVVPGSSRTRIAGLLAGSLKVNISAPPEKGKANKKLIEFLAQLLQRPKSSISIHSGSQDPHKQVFVSQITSQQLINLLEPHL